MYAVPVGLQMLIDHSSLNASDWSVIELGYNNQGPFSSPDELAAAFANNSLDLIRYPRPRTNDPQKPIFSSLRRRGPKRPLESLPLPASVEQGGARYAVRGTQVTWLSWDLIIGFEITSGINFNDIRFRGTRIIYELTLQVLNASSFTFPPPLIPCAFPLRF